VPVGTAYNQWTQFGDFPSFMSGVVEIRQIEAARLLWVATVAGERKEWLVRIIRQVPDKVVSWISESGCDGAGTVIFTSLGTHRAEVELHVEYAAEGFRDLLGDILGHAYHQVEGDLTRFKDFVEGRGFETGAWRGEIMHGRERLVAPLLDSADIPDADQIRFGVSPLQ